MTDAHDPVEEPDSRQHRLELLGLHLAEIAHDLRNPLAAICAQSELLEGAGSATDPRDREVAATRIRKSAEHCRELVDEVLFFVRGEVRPVEAVDAEAFARDFVADRPPLSGIKLRVACRRPLPPIAASPVSLRRILDNLVGNAEAVMIESKMSGSITIELSASEETGDVSLVVADRGPGLPPQATERTWIAARPRRAGGTGLGLAIVEALVQGIGGSIRAENAPGGGARFTCTLPSATSETPKSTQGETASPSQPEDSCYTRRSLRILAVDDDRNTLDVYQRVLELDGHRVDIEERGDRGLALFLSEDYDVALVDMRLQDLSGRRFFEAVQAQQPAKSGRILFATGDLQKAETRAFLNATGHPYLVKPFRIDELRVALSAVVDS